MSRLIPGLITIFTSKSLKKEMISKIKKTIKPCDGYIGENVAYGASNGKDAVNNWKNSSVHRENMLGDYKYIGIGTASNKKGVIYYTQIFVR